MLVKMKKVVVKPGVLRLILNAFERTQVKEGNA